MRQLVLTAAAALALACNHSEPPPVPSQPATLFRVPPEQNAQLKLTTVAQSQVAQPLFLPAQVAFNELRTTDVVSLVDGKVVKLLAREGDFVKVGQPLMAIASPSSADAQANLVRDRAALANTLLVQARDRDLYQHKAISLEELQTAELAVASAKASVATDLTRVRVTGTGAGDAVLRSPISGVIVARRISVGGSVQAGSTSAFTISDPSQVWVVGQLYQDDLRRVAVGDPAEIRSSVLDAPIAARVSYVGASLDPDSLTIPVRIAASNPGGVLKSGMYVDLAISPVHTEREMLVPAFSVLRDSDNLPFVYLQAKPAEYARRHIELGNQVGNSFIVRSGLAEGDKVVGDGALFVQFADGLER